MGSARDDAGRGGRRPRPCARHAGPDHPRTSDRRGDRRMALRRSRRWSSRTSTGTSSAWPDGTGSVRGACPPIWRPSSPRPTPTGRRPGGSPAAADDFSLVRPGTVAQRRARPGLRRMPSERLGRRGSIRRFSTTTTSVCGPGTCGACSVRSPGRLTALVGGVARPRAGRRAGGPGRGSAAGRHGDPEADRRR